MKTVSLDLKPHDNRRLAALCGHCDQHLRHIEQHFQISLHNRAHHFTIKGELTAANAAAEALKRIYAETQHNVHLSPNKIHLLLHTSAPETIDSNVIIHAKQCKVKPRSDNQRRYVERILSHDINFGIGPAGTGKTYLAVACAVQAWQEKKVERILLVRPAVEAGEHLGFLPGDLSQKVDPYLRPLYDALYEMLGFETVEKLLERTIIEIAPLAYMRGRTLNEAFIILDESQNTTVEQMKMFLTRIGFGSTAVINGDLTQIDLPKNMLSGLTHAIDVLKEVKEISFTHFIGKDIVRHPLVQRIVEAYEQYEQQ